ncbi:MAG: polyphosphate kinase 2 family protein [Methanocalculus sp.]|uniref:PPK2 family polyphosphate kinase n=1 Tax=Methanocalculus sp. TaxID=2004547 RepID=UPI0027278CDE|nr:PPK2 family polyphosphate kinase [Methanocalculus sp.]MDO9539631.1 polyphosphate kinase 2 family protein [Methanocalculus sp.]
MIVKPGMKVKISDFYTGWAHNDELKEAGKDVVKQRAGEILEENRTALTTAQELLWADNRYSILIILQGMDTAGKDGTIRHVMSGVNPQGCRVTSFGVPNRQELDHTFLWRFWRATPGRGEIGIFNRSYYEDVLVPKVHPIIMEDQQLPPGSGSNAFWEARYKDIRAFEEHLVANGTIVLKFFLNISKEEQKKRLISRLKTEEKHWKFSLSDLTDRQFWDHYQRAYEEVFYQTSTDSSPWYIIPADYKWVARTLVADLIVRGIKKLDLRYPETTDERKKELEIALYELQKE